MPLRSSRPHGPATARHIGAVALFLPRSARAADAEPTARPAQTIIVTGDVALASHF